MNIFKTLCVAAACTMLGLGAVSCNDGKTYAELLNDETMYVNRFLADQRVVNSIPSDTIFEYGPNAPYYRLDEDGMLYMQVIDPGTPGNKAEYNDLIYFRYTRYNLSQYIDGVLTSSAGNDEVLNGDASFRYGNYNIGTSYTYGTGIQAPLLYLPVDCQVNLVVKSQNGAPDEMSYVIPFLYSIRYFRPKI